MGQITLPKLDLSPLNSAVSDARDQYLAMQRQEAEVKAGQAKVALMTASNQITKDLQAKGDYSNWEAAYQQRMYDAIDEHSAGIGLPVMADQFKTSMMAEVQKALPTVRAQAQQAMVKGAEATWGTALNDALVAGEGVDSTTTKFRAMFGDTGPGEVLLAKFEGNRELATAAWRQGLDATVQATAEKQIQTILADSSTTDTQKLKDVKLWQTRYADPTRADLQPARDVMAKAVLDLKPKVSTETFTSASNSVNQFDSSWDPFTATATTGTGRTAVTKGKIYQAGAAINIEGQVFDTPMAALDALNKGKFTTLDEKDRYNLGNILEGSAQKYKAIQSGLYTNEMKAKADAQTIQWETRFKWLSPDMKNAILQGPEGLALKQSNAGLYLQLLGHVSDPAETAPIFAQDLEAARAKLKDMPDQLAALTGYLNTNINLFTSQGGDPSIAKKRLNDVVNDLRQQGVNSVLGSLIEIRNNPQNAAAREAELVGKKEWLAKAALMATQDELLIDDQAIKDEMVSTLAMAKNRFQMALSSWNPHGVIGEPSLVKGVGIVYPYKVSQDPRAETTQLRVQGGTDGNVWFEQKQGNSWVRVAGDPFRQAPPPPVNLSAPAAPKKFPTLEQSKVADPTRMGLFSVDKYGNKVTKP